MSLVWIWPPWFAWYEPGHPTLVSYNQFGQYPSIAFPSRPFSSPSIFLPPPSHHFIAFRSPLASPTPPSASASSPLVHTSFPPPPPLPSLLSLCTKTNTITSVFHSLTPESSDKDGIRSKVGKGISHFYSKPKICIFSFFIATQHTTPTTLSDCSFFDDYVYIHYTSPRLKHLLTWKLNGPFKCLLWHWSCETQTMNPKFNLFAYWPSN